MFNPFDLVAVFEDCTTIEKAVLFGSRATSTHTEKSDADIAIFGEVTPSDFDKLCATLDELPIVQTFDLIMYNSADADLRQHINEKGLTIYERGLVKPAVDHSIVPVWSFHQPVKE